MTKTVGEDRGQNQRRTDGQDRKMMTHGDHRDHSNNEYHK
jgi:hypothetical protein